MARRNLCPNPAAKHDTAEFTASTAPITRVTDIPGPAPRSTGIRTTGGGYIQTPAADCSPGDVFSLSFYGHNGGSFTEGAKTVYVVYALSGGGISFPESFSITLGVPGNVAFAGITTQPAPANATAVYLLWDSLGTGFGMTALLFEKVGALDAYADGDTPGWAWDGADGNSTSSELTSEDHDSTGLAEVELAATATTSAAKPSAGAGTLAVAAHGAVAGVRPSAGLGTLALAAHGAVSKHAVSAGTGALVVSAHFGDLLTSRSGRPRLLTDTAPTPIASAGIEGTRIVSTTRTTWEAA